MTRVLIIPILASLLLWGLLTSNAQQLLEIPTATENYNLSYIIENETIRFEITVKTTGYIGFGFTNVSGMVRSDIFIGGVLDNGSVYFGDYTSYSAARPSPDEIQNWNVTEGIERNGTTHLKIQRLLSTGDPIDIVIEDQLMNIIWSVGSNDELNYHSFNRSQLKFNLISKTNGGEEPEPPPTPPPTFEF